MCSRQRLQFISLHGNSVRLILLPFSFCFACFLSFALVATLHQLTSEQPPLSPPPLPPTPINNAINPSKLLFDPNSIQSNNNFRHSSTKTITSIALLVPVRAVRGTSDVSQISFFQELIPSLFNAHYFDQCNKHIQLSLYVGYDAGDPFWCELILDDIIITFNRRH